MVLGKVIGTVWGSKQSEGLVSFRVVEIRRVSLQGLQPGARLMADIEGPMLTESTLLAVDSLGADVGQLVVVSIGSRPRDIVVGPGVTTKNTVIAIVDQASVDC
ncbi:MAG TPA: EutN/CcmL family microcompartment protein [Myxococcota bacterium]|nr:EutN/CcmL family microcompartment protein [Myxococcota bacterium]